MSLSLKIKELRLNKKMSQKELADVLNMKRENISNYERGTITNIPSEVLEKIADYFDVSVDYLLDRNVSGEYHDYSPKTMDTINKIMRSKNPIFLDLIEKLAELNDEELKVLNSMADSLIALK